MIKLSVSEKGFAVVKNSKLLKAKGFNVDSKREAILRNLQRGILEIANYVEHEDLLIIEVSDSYTYRWLNSEVPNKNYISQYSATHRVLNKLICRYRFVQSKKLFVDSVDLEHPFVPTSNFEM